MRQGSNERRCNYLPPQAEASYGRRRPGETSIVTSWHSGEVPLRENPRNNTQIKIWMFRSAEVIVVPNLIRDEGLNVVFLEMINYAEASTFATAMVDTSLIEEGRSGILLMGDRFPGKFVAYS